MDKSQWRACMAAVRDGDEADALAAVAFWAREAPRVDRASLATATATLLTALRRPEPALERAAAAALGAIAEKPALGDDLAAIVEPFARAQCGRVPANAADGARRVRSVAAALAALAEGGGSSALLEPLLEAYVPRLRRSAARFDGGLLAADAVARLVAAATRRFPAAAWLAADGGALDAVAEGVARAIEHLFEDGASPELHYATPPPAPGGGAYVVAADEAVVFASPRGVAAGALPRHKRVTATAWDGPDWARVEAPVAGWVRFADLAPRSEAIHSYVAASPLWRQTCGAVAKRNGVARCEAALAKRAGDAAARRVASPRARAALRDLADAGVELRVLRCHANLAARGLPPRLWGRHRDFAGRGVGAVDARDLEGFWGFVRKHEPCVVRGAADVEHRFDGGVQWADLGDDAYLAKRCGHRAVGVRGAYVDGGGAAAGRVFASSATARAPLAAALAERRRADAAGEAAAFYAAKIPLADHLPELDDDVRAVLRDARRGNRPPGSRPNFEPLGRVDSADSWTHRWLSSSPRGTAEAVASKRSLTWKIS